MCRLRATCGLFVTQLTDPIGSAVLLNLGTRNRISRALGRHDGATGPFGLRTSADRIGLSHFAGHVPKGTPHAVGAHRERDTGIVEQHPNLAFGSAVLDATVVGQLARSSLRRRAP